MKKILLFVLIILLIGIPILSAEELISKTSFIIKIYNNTIEIISNEYSGNNQVFNFTITNSTDGNSTKWIALPQDLNFSFLFVKNQSVDMSLVLKYTDCLINGSQNSLIYTQNITTCTMTLSQKDTEISGRQSQIDTLNKSSQDKKNQGYLLFVVGAGLGLGGMYLIKRGGKVKNKKDEFNMGGAG